MNNRTHQNSSRALVVNRIFPSAEVQAAESMEFDENPQEQINLREPDPQTDNHQLENNGLSDVSSLVKQENTPITPEGQQQDNIQGGEVINDIMLGSADEGLTKQEPEIIVYPQKIDRVMRSKNINVRYPPYLIPQKSLFRLIWDSLILVMIAWLILFVPWQIAFPGVQVKPLDWIIVVFFMLDIGITFRTTYYNDDNEEIIDPRLIVMNYLKSKNFWLDVLSSFPVSEVYTGSNVGILRALNLIKLVRLLRLQRLFKLLQNEHVQLAGQLLNYLFAFLLLFHWITCLWLSIVFISVDKNNLNVNNSWVPTMYRSIYATSESALIKMVEDFYLNSERFSSVSQYTSSYYELLMVTLGQDIAPSNVGQSYFLVLVGISGSIALAILFGKMSMVLIKSVLKQQLYEGSREEIEALVYELPKNIRTKSLEYFEFCWRKHIIFLDNQKSFKELSKTLEVQCLAYHYDELMKSVPLFKMIDLQEMSFIIRKLQTLVFMPGEVIYELGENLQEMFFVIEGQIVCEAFSDEEQMNITKGQFYGDTALLGNVKCTSPLRALSFTILESLSRQNFTKCIELLPDLKFHIQDGLTKDYYEQVLDTAEIMTQMDLFIDFTTEDLTTLLINYTEVCFVEKDRLILVEDFAINGFYLIIRGEVEVCGMTSDENGLEAIDIDSILKLQSQHLNFMEQDHILFYLIGTFGQFETFGYLNFDTDSELISKKCFRSIQMTQLAVLTTNHLKNMQRDHLWIYEKLKRNFQELEEQFYKLSSSFNEQPVMKRTRSNLRKVEDKVQTLQETFNLCMKNILEFKK